MSRETAVDLMSLPTEMVERIARLVDDESLHNLGTSHPRFRELCERLISLRRIKSQHVHRFLHRLVSSNASWVESLDLSDCWSTSESMAEVIQRCRSLTELNVVNSSLTVQHLLKVLENLETLKKLSATVTEADDNTRPGSYTSIENIYFEFAPKEVDARFVLRFLKGCKCAKNLRLNVVGTVADPVPSDALDDDEEVLSKYNSVAVFSSIASSWHRGTVLLLIFGWADPLLRCILDLDQHERVFVHEVISDGVPAEPKLKEMYHDHKFYVDRDGTVRPFVSFHNSEETIGVRVIFEGNKSGARMPDLGCLSSLRELDLTESHALHTAATWQSLLDSTPKIEALALPVCALVSSFGPPAVDEGILVTLVSLKLRRLHVKSSGGKCARCTAEVNGLLMMHLRGFGHLEEFALQEARVSEDFLDHITKPLPMRTIKLNVDSLGDDRKLSSFLYMCEKLENLKLEALDLPLSSDLFWRSLSRTSLRRLCLSSTFVSAIDPAKLILNLFCLFRTLNLFHLHARDAENSVIQSIVEGEAKIASRMRELEPFAFVVNKRSLADERNCRGPKLPGRDLCCMESFIGSPKPIGWEVDS